MSRWNRRITALLAVLLICTLSGHTENVLAVRGSDYRILFDGEGGGANHSFFAAEQRGLRNEAWFKL